MCLEVHGDPVGSVAGLCCPGSRNALVALAKRMLTFLQLSDIHFRNRPPESAGSAPARSGESETDAQDYMQRELLIEDARALGERIGGYSGVLVAGDIANTGDREQFSQAAVWLRNLCTAIKVKPWMVWTVPGNHDVDDSRVGELERELRSRLREADEGLLDGLLDAIRMDHEEGPALLGPLENYIEFADSFECAFTPEQLHWVCELGLSDAYPLQMRGLSSPLLCAKGDGTKQTIVGNCQVGDWDVGRLHLSMCHHPHSWLLDHDELDDAFQKNVQVRVTGHLHQRKLECTNIGIYLQAGAVSPARGSDGRYHPGFEPTYDVITLKQVELNGDPFLEIAVHQRAWRDDESRWLSGEQKSRRFPIGREAPSKTLDQRPGGDAHQLEIPMREVRYKLAQLPITDKYECVEQIGAPLASFLDLREFSLVSSIVKWAEDNERLDELAAAVIDDSPA